MIRLLTRTKKRNSVFLGFCGAVMSFPTVARTQSEYRNLESGRPVRVADAIPSELHSLDLDLTSLRFDRLSLGRYRAQLESRVSYGILPRTEISARALGFYREPSAVPRGTVAGVGIGAEYLLKMETLNSPAIGFAGEAWKPTGPNASRASYMFKGLVTRSFTFGRIHLNGGYGNFSYRVPAPPPGGTVLIPPVIDGPCSVSPIDRGLELRMTCGFAELPASAAAQAPKPGDNTGIHWLAGMAYDKSFALHSTMIIADVFTERFESVGRPTDWNAELGIRKQLTPRFVADLGLGRHFKGFSPSWFATVGTTINLAFRP